MRLFTQAARQLDPRQALQRSSVRIFISTLAVTALAKGAAFLPGYSIDDYKLVLQDVPASLAMLRQGRFGQALLSQFLYLLRIEPTYARVLFVALGLAVWSFLGTLVVRHWGLERKGWLALAVAALVANHPYTAEIFTFRTALGTVAIALGLFALLLIPRRWSPPLVLLGSLLFAAALSIYQLILHFSVMIALMGMAIWLTRILVAGGAQGWPERVTSLLSPGHLARHRHTALLTCTVLGTFLYLAANQLIAAALGFTLGARTEFIAPGALLQRLRDAGDVLRFRLASNPAFEPPSDPLISASARNLLLLLLLAAGVGLLARMKPRLRLRAPLLCAAIGMLVAVSLVWILGLLLVLREFWPAARVISHTGIFWGGVLAIAYECAGPFVRRGLALVSLVLALSFIGANNRILNDQIRLNVRDAQKANRILTRLEVLPGFSKVELVAFTGTAWRYPLGFGTQDHDMNISAFGAEWTQPAILREISGYDLKPADEAQKKAAAAYCHNVEPWPGPQSITIQDRLAIVCLQAE